MISGSVCSLFLNSSLYFFLLLIRSFISLQQVHMPEWEAWQMPITSFSTARSYTQPQLSRPTLQGSTGMLLHMCFCMFLRIFLALSWVVSSPTSHLPIIHSCFLNLLASISLAPYHCHPASLLRGGHAHEREGAGPVEKRLVQLVQDWPT